MSEYFLNGNNKIFLLIFASSLRKLFSWKKKFRDISVDMKFGTPVKQFFRDLIVTLIVTIFMTIDARFVILWDLEFFEKRTW